MQFACGMVVCHFLVGHISLPIYKLPNTGQIYFLTQVYVKVKSVSVEISFHQWAQTELIAFQRQLRQQFLDQEILKNKLSNLISNRD